MSASVLTCRNVAKRYRDQYIFQKISFSIPAGQLISLVGPSGCGKTTLLRCLAGLEPVTEGQILVEGVDVTRQKAAQRPIVLMFQQPLLFPHLTILENVIYGLQSQPLTKRERIERGVAFLERIKLEEYRERFPYELSGGQKQRVALARALIIKPKLLLLDEPFSSLDPGLRTSIRSWVRQLLKEEGITSLFVTHDKEEAMIMGDQVAVMKKGQIQQIGLPLDVYQKPRNRIVAEFFSEGLVLDQERFVALQHLKLTRLLEKEPIQSATEGFRGRIMNQWLKHGQRFYEVQLEEFQQALVISSPDSFQLGEVVQVVLKNETYHHLQPVLE